MAEAEPRDRDGNPVRLVTVDREGASVRHGAEAAISRAGVAKEHERGRLVPPALTDVRTMCLLAHRVKAKLLHGGAGLREVRTTWRPDLQPGWVAADGWRAHGAARRSAWASGVTRSQASVGRHRELASHRPPPTLAEGPGAR